MVCLRASQYGIGNCLDSLVQWGFEIWTCPDFECVKEIGLQMIRFPIESEIGKPDHLNTDQNGRHFVFTI